MEKSTEIVVVNFVPKKGLNSVGINLDMNLTSPWVQKCSWGESCHTHACLLESNK